MMADSLWRPVMVDRRMWHSWTWTRWSFHQTVDTPHVTRSHGAPLKLECTSNNSIIKGEIQPKVRLIFPEISSLFPDGFVNRPSGQWPDDVLVNQVSFLNKKWNVIVSLLVTGKLSDFEVNFLLVHHFMGLWNFSTGGNSSVQTTYLTRFWSFDVTGYGVHQPLSKFLSMWVYTSLQAVHVAW